MSIWVVICAALVCFWVAKVLIWVWWKPRKLEKLLREQGFNGTSHMYMFGDLKQLVSTTKKARSKPIELSHSIVPRVFPFIQETIQRQGPMSYIWFGVTPRVNILDPDLIKDVLSNKFGHFSKIKVNPLLRLLAQGVANYDGEKWAKHRRIISPAFHLEKLKLMVPAFHASCIDLVEKWEKLVSNGSSEVDVWPDLQELTADAISRTAFGSSYEKGRRIFQLQTEQIKLVLEVLPFVFIPGFRYTKSRFKSSLVLVQVLPMYQRQVVYMNLILCRFLPTKKNRRIKEIDREVRSILSDMINYREKATKNGELAHTNDLLGMLLDCNRKHTQENDNSKKFGMAIEDVIEECKLFYIAGQETTSSLLVWTMVVLSMHPEWQARAREEVLRVFGSDKPNLDALSHLKIVTMIFYEVLRLYPPAALLLRYCYKEMKLGYLTLPPGVEIAIPTILVHHDRTIWGKDAEEFNPMRFSEGISKVTNNQVSFFPFGWGPRICLGQAFSLIEAKMAIAMILQRFSFELSPTYAHAPYTLLTLRPQYGAQMILNKL
ncbi:hypothetical protein Sjap_025762 [Stephania japonica]|uniref:Cytochrome P450 n=1 Tax=Stephania japonica TaxID=461633 RepID=A0AAP0HI97_9MAGN